MINNFDMSSTGVNIEFDAHLSSDSAQIDFSHNIENLTEQHSRNATNIFFYHEGGRYSSMEMGELFNAPIEGLSNREIIELLETQLKDGYAYTKSVGYSQGDVAYVIYKKHDNNPIKFINNLLWDSPIYGELKIDNEVFYIDEFLDDLYEWDKVSFIENFTKTLQHPKKEVILNWLNDNLPNELEYI